VLGWAFEANVGEVKSQALLQPERVVQSRRLPSRPAEPRRFRPRARSRSQYLCQAADSYDTSLSSGKCSLSSLKCSSGQQLRAPC